MKPQLATMLRSAAKQVKAVTDGLDRTVKNCEQCQAPRWQNRTEYQMAVELDAVIGKLNRFAKQLVTEPAPEN
jgi:23S rRNA maturation mini-RNase III